MIATIVAAPAAIWAVDADDYSPEAIDVIFEVSGRLRRSLPGGRSDTLVTKTMLGVFGCVPAFDRFFRVGLGVATFGRKALRKVTSFYAAHDAIIERYRVPTLDFATGEATTRRYTRAKVVDMVFFIEGAGLGTRRPG